MILDYLYKESLEWLVEFLNNEIDAAIAIHKCSEGIFVNDTELLSGRTQSK